jgi:hyaluronan synthase
LPTIDVIIPAYNEEKSVYDTIKSIVNTNYPKDKINIIVANDGSTDNTQFEVERAVVDFGKNNKITFLNHKKNSGKRTMMYKGVKSTEGEIIVFVDSDSYLTKNSLKQIIKPFAKSEKIGAVAGHARVFNKNENNLTRMQEVLYFNAFRTAKAAESLFGTVTCCSGCFSAYRRVAIMPIIEEWLNQKFLGVKCTYGEDRGLTNLILRSGFDTVYNQKAITYTVVPNNFKGYIKQQLRWKKSYAHENLVMCTFLLKRDNVNAFYITFDRIIAPIVTPVIFTVLIVELIKTRTLLYLFSVILSYAIMILCYGYYYKLHNPKERGWLLGSMYVTFFQIMLIYQLPYAILRTRNSSWSTK